MPGHSAAIRRLHSLVVYEQWRGSAILGLIHRRARLEQGLDALVRAGLRRAVQRRPSGVAGRSGVGAGIDEIARQLRVAALGGLVRGRSRGGEGPLTALGVTMELYGSCAAIMIVLGALDHLTCERSEAGKRKTMGMDRDGTSSQTKHNQ